MKYEINPNTDTFYLSECKGTLISGTMRNADLIPDFMEAIRHTNEYCQMIINPFGPIPAYAIEDDDSEWWNSEDAHDLLYELFDILNVYAPAGYDFGAHPGNGSDYGFWSIIEEDDYMPDFLSGLRYAA